jgi:hypothetical protein
MSAQGTDLTVKADLILDLDKFAQATAKAKHELEKSDRDAAEAEKRAKERREAAKKAFATVVKAAQVTYQAVSASMERLSQQLGANDPAVRAFRDMQQSVTGVFDSFVKGIAGSRIARAAMEAIASAANQVAKGAEALGESLDRWVKDNAGALVTAGGMIGAAFGAAAVAFDVVMAAVKALWGVVQLVYAGIFKVFELAAKGVAKVSEWLGSDSLRDSARRFAETMGSVSSELGAAATDNLKSAAGDFATAMSGALNKIASSAEEGAKRVQAAIDRSQELPSAEEERTSIFGFDRTAQEKVLEAVQHLAAEVEATFAGMAAGIQGAFDKIRQQFDPQSMSATWGAFGDAFGGLTAFASQAERAFGTSSRAAKIFAKVQLGIMATLAAISGTEQAAAAAKAGASGNAGTAALHIAASGLYFAAAGLAGGQAAELIRGGGAGGSRGGSGSERPEDGVTQRQTVINLNIEGNLLGNEEYVRGTVVPALRRLVEQEDVVLQTS